ncbi:MAG: hypothetical protein M3T56_10260 [Chloroflexota bacterium]|nr:hypothetical protein [Chloroflexota bacterium]
MSKGRTWYGLPYPLGGTITDREEVGLSSSPTCMRDDQVRALLERLGRAMTRMDSSQRERLARRVLEGDPDLASAVPTLIAMIRNTKRLRLPLHRDGVG